MAEPSIPFEQYLAQNRIYINALAAIRDDPSIGGNWEDVKASLDARVAAFAEGKYIHPKHLQVIERDRAIITTLLAYEAQGHVVPRRHN